MPELAVVWGRDQNPVCHPYEIDAFCSVWLFAQMMFPDSANKLSKFATILRKQIEYEGLDHKPDDYEIADFYLKKELLNREAPLQRGIYAGETLFSLRQMHEHGPIRGREPSREQAYYLVGHRHDAKPRTVRNGFEQYRAVSHYWAAFCLYCRVRGEPLASPELAEFLLLAGHTFLSFGLKQISGPGDKATPYLAGEEVYQPPAHLEIDNLDIEGLPALNEDDVSVLWRYESAGPH